MPSDSPRTLVVILTMHRSGSSLVANLLAELGMSLGPFPLLLADQHNVHGYFESVPFCEVDRLVLQELWGFTGDMPGTPEKLRRLCDAQGRWPDPINWARLPIDHALTALRSLIQSGPISGFKDPRLVLTWPFWERVLCEFPQVRVVPVIVLRSPHEIAMSLFTRSMGAVDYCDALDMSAVYLTRMKALAEKFGSACAVVRFGTARFNEDMCLAVRTIGLPWREESSAQLFKPASVHQKSLRIRHVSQNLFDGLTGADAATPGEPDVSALVQDAKVRENLLRQTRAVAQSAALEGNRLVNLLQHHLAEANDRLAKAQARIAELEAQIAADGNDPARSR